MTIKKVFYKAPHNYDYEEESNNCTIKDFGPSLTVQSQAEDVDINIIMKRFGVTGKMPENLKPIMYEDFNEIFDFATAQHAVIDAQQRFDAMPADIRARFGNNPQLFLDFASNLTNLEELRKMGLAIPKQPENTNVPPTTKTTTGNTRTTSENPGGDGQAPGGAQPDGGKAGGPSPGGR